LSASERSFACAQDDEFKGVLMTKTNHQSGIDAETACKDYLSAKGYEIVATRYKTKAGEIDIIARSPEQLLFIEVKRRKSEIIDDPITKVQKKRIINAALQYISENPKISTLDMRFDCILVDNELALNHIEDGWRIEEI